MADTSLSQDEINALLSGADDLNGPSGGGNSFDDLMGGGSSVSLSSTELSQLGKIINSAARAQGASLSALTSKEANIKISSTSVKGLTEALMAFSGEVVIINVPYTAPDSGNVYYIFTGEDGRQIASLASGSDVDELDEMATSAIQETINNMVGGSDTQIGAEFSINLSNNAPKVAIGDAPDSITIPDGDYYCATCNASTSDGIHFEYIMLFTLPFAKAMTVSKRGGQSNFNVQNSVDDLDSLLGGGGNDIGNVNIQNAEFSQLTHTAQSEHTGNMGLLLDVPMEVTVELGRSTKTVQEVLSLGEGSIIELDKLAGEPVEILVNGKTIAKGEVVVIDENFGVRVTEIVNVKQSSSKEER